jgi:hypothetical protein
VTGHDEALTLRTHIAAKGVLLHSFDVRRLVTLMAVVAVGCSSPTLVVTSDSLDASCATDPRVEAFQPGMVAKGPAGASFTIVTAAPPMVQEGMNTWTVAIHDGTGAPVDGTVTISPFMPDHGHGSPTPATITPMGGGQYGIAGINLSMQGVWAITIGVTSPTVNDSVAFTFCVDGTTS